MYGRTLHLGSQLIVEPLEAVRQIGKGASMGAQGD
jgi:hypothetical protein